MSYCNSQYLFCNTKKRKYLYKVNAVLQFVQNPTASKCKTVLKSVSRSQCFMVLKKECFLFLDRAAHSHTYTHTHIFFRFMPFLPVFYTFGNPVITSHQHLDHVSRITHHFRQVLATQCKVRPTPVLKKNHS